MCRGLQNTIYHVAEQNIAVVKDQKPCESLMHVAGRYFKAWDGERGVFVSNMREEYPDD